MRTPLKFGAAAVAGVLAVGALGAVTAIGENAITPAASGGAWSAEQSAARTAVIAQETQAQEAIEFAGALDRARLNEYALVVYLQKVEQAEAAAAAAAAAQAATTGGGGAGGALASIRACESGGNYGAVSSGGQYRGAYQFDYQTWASVGGSGDPAAASPAEQDMRAQQLLNRSGSSPWPNCG
jgi:peptidoglycan endopeptidase LytE